MQLGVANGDYWKFQVVKSRFQVENILNLPAEKVRGIQSFNEEENNVLKVQSPLIEMLLRFYK